MGRVLWIITKVILKVLGWVLLVAAVIFAYLNWPVRTPDKSYHLGVTFSMRYAGDIGLDWKEAYLATLDDLKARKIRIPVYWDWVEKEEGKYDFSDIDWQLDEAAKRNADIVLTVGQKVPRWPECFIPEWAQNDDAKRKEKLIEFIDVAINHFKNYSAVKIWQVENEPFLNFGICPALDTNLLDREIATVKSVDSSRPIMTTDSGELSTWVPAAKRGDVFGTTMYRKVYTKKYGYWEYPIGPNFFRFKAWYTRHLTHVQNISVIELQGEPWVQGWTTSFPMDKQLESLDENQLRKNVEFAKKTGIEDIYIWGVEWWYWAKKHQNYPQVWDTAKELFSQNGI